MSESPPSVKVGRAVWLSAATMTSRVLGLARDQLFAVLVGANRFSDAFVVAFRIPNLLRDLFAEGALSSAFVPTFADCPPERGPRGRLPSRQRGGRAGPRGGGRDCAAGVRPSRDARARHRARLSAEQALAALLTRIMMPFLLLVSLSAVVMGMLNAQCRFTAPALAPALFNVGAIPVGVGLWLAGLAARACGGRLVDRHAPRRAPSSSRSSSPRCARSATGSGPARPRRSRRPRVAPDLPAHGARR